MLKLGLSSSFWHGNTENLHLCRCRDGWRRGAKLPQELWLPFPSAGECHADAPVSACLKWDSLTSLLLPLNLLSSSVCVNAMAISPFIPSHISSQRQKLLSLSLFMLVIYLVASLATLPFVPHCCHPSSNSAYSVPRYYLLFLQELHLGRTPYPYIVIQLPVTFHHIRS